MMWRGKPSHGLCGTGAYNSWQLMKARCKGKDEYSRKHYQSRGIGYCKRWEKFSNFIEDMGPRPEGKTLERIDNNKGYTPKNCKWATSSQQNRNRRATSNTGLKNIYLREGSKIFPYRVRMYPLKYRKAANLKQAKIIRKEMMEEILNIYGENL